MKPMSERERLEERIKQLEADTASQLERLRSSEGRRSVRRNDPKLIDESERANDDHAYSAAELDGLRRQLAELDRQEAKQKKPTT